MNSAVTVAPVGARISRKALADAFALTLGLKGGEALDPVQASFLAQVHAHYAADELADIALDDFGALLHGFWAFGERRKRSETHVHLVPAKGADGQSLGLDVLEAVQTDSPFLVDSVMGALVEAGVTVRAMLHPVVEVGRDKRGARDATAVPRRESMIHVLLDPVGEDRRGDILASVEAALADVRLAVEDFPEMQGLMSRTIAELETTAVGTPDLDEHLAFLRWLQADRFVFLGARVYGYVGGAGGYDPGAPMTQGLSLGILRDPERTVLRSTNEPAVLSAEARRHLGAGAPLVVAKANSRSRVHRRAHMDYIGVKRYDEDGQACGEVRFLGLFTSEAYDQPVQNVPLVRRKVERLLAKAGAAPESHNGRRLRNILESYPRDELFQIDEEALRTIALKILHLYDRPRLRLFARKDPFDRFVSVLLFMPRDRYNAEVASKAGVMLAEAWGGRVSAAYPSFSDAPLARVHYILGLDPGVPRQTPPRDLEARILEAIRTWEDRFEALVRERAPDRAGDILVRYRGAFPLGYRDQFDAADALADIGVLDELADAPVQVRVYAKPGDAAGGLRLKLYRQGEAAALSDILPIVESMGLRALSEHGFPIRRPGDAADLWVHEIVLADPRGAALDLEAVKAPFEEAFEAVWIGQTENDGFNRLVLELGVSWREAALVRALARYRQQTGLDPSQAVQEAALSDNPGIARLILDMFRLKFDTATDADVPARVEQAETAYAAIVAALQTVQSLDADRVLRRLALLVRATKRTNYYQPGEGGQPKPYISFKVASREIDDLPLPKPYREIFVWAPHVEGVHLRFGPVARGGLRWSDRRDDFRTEVLGLAKAQQVKNAVIVPVGAKGGFYPKALPRGGGNDEIRAEGIRAYKTFLFGLLDITDNLDPDGQVIPPPDVIRHEADDAYLVVAADKGTASFSDIANGVAEAYGFWLGDAFASGGSAGYDHKEMAITARGAWEAVKRHFREMGKDIQSQPFTVVGVGDMSGDVFGNGMLLSRHTRLLAAFDHRHIFLDPDPDAAASFGERQRLFDLPRSSWADYDAGLISQGGGVYPRTAKSIPLSGPVKAMLDVSDEALAPSDLIRAILKAPAELLYMGGIGTYVKAPTESHADVGDKATDPLRIDAGDLRVKVVGEGANLGFTQAGRIVFAAGGGRINTDAIDNSAGVDSSDHEVNIKIMTGAAEHKGRLSRKARNTLLVSMTDAVADHVLDHNYQQTLALSLQEATAVADLDSHARFMSELVEAGRLDRKVEGLPGPSALIDLAKAGKGLTRPELAVLLAYGKLELSHEITASSAPEDPVFAETLKAYFPAPLARFGAEMAAHPLRREIIATVLANDMVNLAGPTFPPRLRAAAGCDTRALVVAFEAARRVFRIDELWSRISALDAQASAVVQTTLYLETAAMLRRQVFWLARRAVDGEIGVEALTAAYRPAADTLRKEGVALFSPFERAFVEGRIAAHVEAGAPADLAADVGALAPLVATSDVADVALGYGWPTLAVGRVYHQIGAAFGFDRLRTAASSLAGGDQFERRAVRRLIEDLLTEQAALTGAMVEDTGTAPATADALRRAVEAWTAGRAGGAAAQEALAEVEAAEGGWTFAKLTIVAAALRQLAER